MVYSHPGTILMAYFASGSTYRIFNPMGQLVAQGTITDDHQPVSGLAGGLYIVKVQQGTQDITRKLLVP